MHEGVSACVTERWRLRDLADSSKSSSPASAQAQALDNHVAELPEAKSFLVALSMPVLRK